MQSSNPGFRVFTRIHRPAPDLIAALGELETTYLADAMNRFGGMGSNVRPV